MTALDTSVTNVPVSVQFSNVEFPNASSATNDSFKVQSHVCNYDFFLN